MNKSDTEAPPPATTIGVYSSLKTDASPAGTRSNKSEPLSDTQPTSSEEPVEPNDMPTSLTTSESTAVRDAESAVKEVTEVKEVNKVTGVEIKEQEGTEETTSEKVGVPHLCSG